MKTTIVIDVDKLGLWRALTWFKNMGVKVETVQVGSQAKQPLVDSAKAISEVCEVYVLEEQKLREEVTIKPIR